MTTPRGYHTANLLPSGQVLVTGGNEPTVLGLVGTAELYDPSTGTWTEAAPMAMGRSEHTGTLLPDGRVLVTGGFGAAGILATTEVFDPTLATWTNGRPLANPRRLHSAALLPNGRLFIRDGIRDEYELYDPVAATGRFGVIGLWPQLISTATYLPIEGAVLLPSTRRYDVARDEFLLHDVMTVPLRSQYTATLLMLDPLASESLRLRVLVTGGIDFITGRLLASAEVFETDWWSTIPDMTTPRFRHSATSLADGRVLIAGGMDACGGAIASAEIFDPLGL